MWRKINVWLKLLTGDSQVFEERLLMGEGFLPTRFWLFIALFDTWYYNNHLQSLKKGYNNHLQSLEKSYLVSHLSFLRMARYLLSLGELKTHEKIPLRKEINRRPERVAAKYRAIFFFSQGVFQTSRFGRLTVSLRQVLVQLPLKGKDFSLFQLLQLFSSQLLCFF